MSRITASVLLVAAGLGIGLWLGINPESRAAVQETWQSAGDSIARLQTDLNLELGRGSAAPAEDQSANEGMRSDQASPLASLTRLLNDLWEATQELWSSVMARVEASG